jgi:site-specific DNA-methyltransferase (adenine-specific)
MEPLWEQYKRIIKPAGAIVLFAQTPFDKVLGASNIEMLKYEWIWEKDSGTGHLNSKFAPMKKHENILVFSKKAACFVKNPEDAMTYYPQMESGKPYTQKSGRPSLNYDAANCHQVITENKGERYPTSVLKFNRDKTKIHPTQKPVDLVAYLVRTYTNPNDVILDNCMGSGTTAIACIKERRHFIGFELNKDFYDKACRRIKDEQSQLTLDLF